MGRIYAVAYLLLALLMNLAMAFKLIAKLPPVRSLSLLRYASRKSFSTYMSSSDDSTEEVKKVDDTRKSSRPPIIPFDFARDDIMPPNLTKKLSGVKETTDKISDSRSTEVVASAQDRNVWLDDADFKAKADIRTANNDRRNKWVEDPSRPTGYGNVDEDDDDWVPSSDSEGVEKFLKDYFFNSPYDSPKRRDAKFVIRNVTLISGVLGTIFTILFYAFPGRFISYRGTADFSQRYSSDFVNKDPSELLNDKVNEDIVREVEIGGETFYDDGVGMPGPDESRVAYPKKASDGRAPGRTMNL